MKRVASLAALLAFSIPAQARECNKIWAVVACYPDDDDHRSVAMVVRSEWAAKIVEFNHAICVAEGPYPAQAQAQKKVLEYRRFLRGLKASGALSAAYTKRDCSSRERGGRRR